MIKKQYNISALREQINLVEEIIDEYIYQHLSMPIIANMHCLSITTIRNILIANSVQLRQKNNR